MTCRNLLRLFQKVGRGRKKGREGRRKEQREGCIDRSSVIHHRLDLANRSLAHQVPVSL